MDRSTLGRWGVGALALALLFTQPAAADTLRYDGPMYAPYYGSYTISLNPPGPDNTFTRSLAAGGFRMTNISATPQNSFMAWCVDIFGTVQSTANYTLRSGAEFYGAGSRVVTNLERLASYAFDHWTAANNFASAAFQLAVWEIVNEPTAAYSLSGDQFTVTSGSSAVRSLAGSWLQVVNAGTYGIDQQLSVWQKGQNATTQNLAVFAPIPEPETYMMLLAGLGLMAFVARRRQHDGAIALS
jgi:hypothetical protein